MGAPRSLSFSQGFHRYSTDFSWHVPHFEKMLYDQAQLAVAYITASQVCIFVSISDTVTVSPSLCLSVYSSDLSPCSALSEKKQHRYVTWQVFL